MPSSARSASEYRWRRRVLPWGFILLGLVVVATPSWVLSDSDGWQPPLREVLVAIGGALVVAALLALTVDYAVKRDIVRDAFRASFGYLLPEPLKDEIRCLFTERVLCIEHDLHIELLERTEPNVVTVKIVMWRTLVNVSNQAETWKPSFTVDKLGMVHDPEHDGRVAVFRCIRDGKEDTAPPPRWAASEAEGQLRAEFRRSVTLAPGEECTLVYEAYEVRRTTDAYYLTLVAPTRCPVVYVEAPSTLAASVTFGARDSEKTAKHGNRYTHPTTLLPFQTIQVRWWPREHGRVERDASLDGVSPRGPASLVPRSVTARGDGVAPR